MYKNSYTLQTVFVKKKKTLNRSGGLRGNRAAEHSVPTTVYCTTIRQYAQRLRAERKSNFLPIVGVDGDGGGGAERAFSRARDKDVVVVVVAGQSSGYQGWKKACPGPYCRRARSPRQRHPAPQVFSSPVILFAPQQASSPPARLYTHTSHRTRETYHLPPMW